MKKTIILLSFFVIMSLFFLSAQEETGVVDISQVSFVQQSQNIQATA